LKDRQAGRQVYKMTDREAYKQAHEQMNKHIGEPTFKWAE